MCESAFKMGLLLSDLQQSDITRCPRTREPGAREGSTPAVLSVSVIYTAGDSYTVLLLSQSRLSIAGS